MISQDNYHYHLFFNIIAYKNARKYYKEEFEHQKIEIKKLLFLSLIFCISIILEFPLLIYSVGFLLILFVCYFLYNLRFYILRKKCYDRESMIIKKNIRPDFLHLKSFKK